jgi:hypothetical protein
MHTLRTTFYREFSSSNCPSSEVEIENLVIIRINIMQNNL